MGPQGEVLGINLVDGVLELARERARQEGLENITFQVADAEALEVGARTFDVATVRGSERGRRSCSPNWGSAAQGSG